MRALFATDVGLEDAAGAAIHRMSPTARASGRSACKMGGLHVNCVMARDSSLANGAKARASVSNKCSTLSLLLRRMSEARLDTTEAERLGRYDTASLREATYAKAERASTPYTQPHPQPSPRCTTNFTKEYHLSKATLLSKVRS